jgi:hypothetical protein
MRDSGTIETKNISGTVEPKAADEEDYERAMRDAMAWMEKGFPMGDIPGLNREALHDRAPLWPRESR